MKATLAKTIMAAVLTAYLGICPGVIQAQDAKEKLVELANPTIQAQQTPDIEAKGVKPKRWKPKDWLEFEVPFVASAPKTARGEFRSFDELNFKFYLLLDSPDKEKRKVLTADVSYVNVPVGEAVAAVVYLSPTAILNLTGKTRVEPGAAQMWGVEVTYNNNLVGFLSSGGKAPGTPAAEWWKSDKAPPQASGLLKNKTQTPFAPLWGDYHCEVKASN